MDIEISRWSIEKATSYREEFVYEYQRWRPLFGWVGKDKLLPTDPGSVSSYNGEVFAANFEEILEKLPQEWIVLSELHNLVCQ